MENPVAAPPTLPSSKPDEGFFRFWAASAKIASRVVSGRTLGAGGWFVGCTQLAFGRALQIGFKHIGSDFILRKLPRRDMPS
jgi:hypothetical protein